VFRGVNTELGTTVLIVTHDPDIAYKVGRVVMIRDGKIATEIKRKVSYRREQGEADDELDELTVVDPAGRVQLPRDDLDRVRIRDRARVIVEEDRLNIVPEDYQE
jgi:ABC-type multidrug transport system ATPase subunit